MTLLLVIVAAYLLGSIPFGYLLTRLAGLGDIRTVGSGNIGATNVLRTGRKGLAAATLALDAAKGAAAVLLARHFGLWPAYAAGLAVFLGHLFPIWLGFRGGKGVATGLGLLLAGALPVGLVACLVWLAVGFLSRTSSAGALAAFAAAPLAALAIHHDRLAVLALVIAALVYWKHAANIARLRAGTEPRIGRR